jgi:uncharacterized protein YjbI with pentapeptide repeats
VKKVRAIAIQTEKQRIEPFAAFLDQADIFRIFEKLSPVLEAFGVIAIPIVIWWMTESGQEAKEKAEKAARAQEAVKTYLNQLSTVFLDGNLEKDERLRVVTRASTLALLNDPNLEGKHKGQVIDYLNELNLIQIELRPPNSQDLKPTEPIISLAKADFRDADLRSTTLRDADMRDADMRDADLSSANLSGANLSDADMRSADLRGANLSDADIRGANLWGANLESTNLRGADLRGANLRSSNLRGAVLRGAALRATAVRGADLWGADLWGADLSDTDINDAKLCRTILPLNSKLDRNRDCKVLGIPVP